MTRRCLQIGVRTRTEGERALRAAFDRVQKGDLTPQESGLYFESVTALRRILTDKRLDLLLAIVQHHPGSIRELAARLGRDYKNVSDDIACLRQLGLVETKERGGKGGPKVPAVPYDEIRVTIALRPDKEAQAA